MPVATIASVRLSAAQLASFDEQVRERTFAILDIPEVETFEAALELLHAATEYIKQDPKGEYKSEKFKPISVNDNKKLFYLGFEHLNFTSLKIEVMAHKVLRQAPQLASALDAIDGHYRLLRALTIRAGYLFAEGRTVNPRAYQEGSGAKRGTEFVFMNYVPLAPAIEASPDPIKVTASYRERQVEHGDYTMATALSQTQAGLILRPSYKPEILVPERSISVIPGGGAFQAFGVQGLEHRVEMPVADDRLVLAHFFRPPVSYVRRMGKLPMRSSLTEVLTRPLAIEVA